MADTPTDSRAVLAELVTLKDLRTRADSLNTSGSPAATVQRREWMQEYERRKPLAWAAARAALAQPAPQEVAEPAAGKVKFRFHRDPDSGEALGCAGQGCALCAATSQPPSATAEAATSDLGERIQDEVDADGAPYTAERLSRWLDAKFDRHHESEDRAAANWIRRRAAADLVAAEQAGRG